MLGLVKHNLRQSVFTLFRGQLVEGLCLLFAQESLVVVLKAVSVVVGVVAQVGMVMDAFLLSRDCEGGSNQEVDGCEGLQQHCDSLSATEDGNSNIIYFLSKLVILREFYSKRMFMQFKIDHD